MKNFTCCSCDWRSPTVASITVVMHGCLVQRRDRKNMQELQPTCLCRYRAATTKQVNGCVAEEREEATILVSSELV